MGHVFLSHSSKDKRVVEAFAHAMKDVGIVPWFDKWDLSRGKRWQPQLDLAIRSSTAMWVFVGPDGPGPWQAPEIEKAIEAAVRDPERTVTPIVLAGGELGRWGFLDGYQGEVTGITNAPPEEEDKRGEWLSQIASVVALLQQTVDSAAALSPQDSDQVEPYRGLQPFDEAHAGWMFGREDDVQELLGRMRNGQGFLCLTGASGSGKSSLVRAGLVPAVRTGQLDGSFDWRVIVMRPGGTPSSRLAEEIVGLRRFDPDPPTDARLVQEGRELASALENSADTLGGASKLLLRRQPDAMRLLIVVDQLEELFRETRSRKDREAFLNNLMRAADGTDSAVLVVATLRADFVGEALALPQLAGRLKDGLQCVLPPMRRDQLFDVIVRPALRLGVRVDDAVRDDMLEEIAGQPGQLPLLEYALTQLWDRRVGGVLTYESYADLGRMRGAVTKTADEVVARLTEREREVAFRILGRLVHLGEGAGDTRRRVTRAELALDEMSGKVLDTLIASRLVTVDDSRSADREGTVEIAHEVLIREWELLRRILQDRREALPIEHAIAQSARAYRENGSQREELWSGGRLQRAWEMLELGRLKLSAGERNFLSRSWRRARLRAWLVRIALSLAIALAPGILYVEYRIDPHDNTYKRTIARVRLALGSYHKEPDLVRVVVEPSLASIGMAPPIGHVYSIGKYEVTFDEYDRFALTTGRRLPDSGDWERGQHPVVNVSWDDATAYAAWLKERTGRNYRLPTSAEWEYAARGGTTTRFWWGDTLGDGEANCWTCPGVRHRRPVPVKSFPANPFGLHHTSGNVWEWVEDCKELDDGDRHPSAAFEATATPACDQRHIRGGSFTNREASLLTTAVFSFRAGFKDVNGGFRLACDC